MFRFKINIERLILLLIGTANFFITSCSVEKNYKTLSYFFDGVPDPNAKPVQTDTNNLAMKEMDLKQYVKSEKTYTHPPYGDKACENCHDANAANHLNSNQPGLCYQCHDDFGKNFKYVHGPAASGYCTQCHEPHQGKYQKLLIRNGQNLCYYCHDKKDVMKNEVHSEIEDTKCWECHNPHGSNERFFLK
ncbi:MAG: hypothetical protein EPN82_08895 [Bacteroidetes bacterium]|nr:MAG: hypothetical protein EPN82_08895 [Bacteroidota bacterium]